MLIVGGCAASLLEEHLEVELSEDLKINIYVLGLRLPISRSALEITGMTILYYCGLWGIYRAICEKYDSLEDLPIFFLNILFIFSALLALVFSWSQITGWLLFIRPLLESSSLLNAILVFQWILLDMVLIAMPWFVAVRSGQGLYNKRFRRP